jgi:subtilisin family serine protease
VFSDITENLFQEFNTYLASHKKDRSSVASASYLSSATNSASDGVSDIDTRTSTTASNSNKLVWENIRRRYSSEKSTHIPVSIDEMHCDKMIITAIEYHDRGFQVLDLTNSQFPTSSTCLAEFVYYLSTSNTVLSVAIQTMPKVLNYEARGHLQSGTIEREPYTEAGLRGAGQIVGIADSGLYDMSCFFIDDSNLYPTITTDRTGVLEIFRRKVVQYISYADNVDEYGGHGTHVAGSVAGNSLSGELSHMNGMAPDAKIAFYDIGMTDKSFLKVPPVKLIFEEAYRAGVRIHTNSWGNLGGIYGPMSFDCDEFLYEHDDMIILFAAGNSGIEGPLTINAPSNAKNVLTVGAGQIRSVYDDRVLSTTEEYTVAEFSSIGPTFDGRIKPDIIAPGDFIQSAFAGLPSNLSQQISAHLHGSTTGSGTASTPCPLCAVQQMSGTSMATPLTAGTVALIREYFMNPSFWSKYCNPRYHLCQSGAFTPSGYLLKALVLHSGQAVALYSDPVYDYDKPYFQAKKLNSPPDVFQGYGQIVLENILPLSKYTTSTSTAYNHYEENPSGLQAKDLDLIVLDRLTINAEQTLAFKILIPHANSYSTGRIPPLKVTLVWYDPPHILGASMNRILLHDLDLIVESPNHELAVGNKPNLVFDQATASNILDDENPNEQVTIEKPQCSNNNLNCIYTVYIQSHVLVSKSYQSFALVITTDGVLLNEEPVVFNEILFDSNQEEDVDPTSDLPLASSAVLQTSFDVDLYGAQAINTSLSVIGTCQPLSYLNVSLIFTNPNHNLDNWPYNIELSIVDVHGKGVAVGGIDSSVRKASIITEWPDQWFSSADGSYHAMISVLDAELYGEGDWTVYLMNSWSASSLAHYDLNIQLYFLPVTANNMDGSYRDCIPIVPSFYTGDNSTDIDNDIENISSTPTLQPTISATTHGTDRSVDGFYDPLYDAPSDATIAIVTVPINNVSLAVRESKEGNRLVFVPDRYQLASFVQYGQLERIILTLDAYEETADGTDVTEQKMTQGTNAWLLTVIVRAPVTVIEGTPNPSSTTSSSRMSAVIGGIDYFPIDNHFYSRRWPDSWIFRQSHGIPWIAERDVHAAGMMSSFHSASSSGTSKRNIFQQAAIEKKMDNTEYNIDEELDREEHFCQQTSSCWEIEVAVGFQYHARSPVQYSGRLQLVFNTHLHLGTSSITGEEAAVEEIVWWESLFETKSNSSQFYLLSGGAIFLLLLSLCFLYKACCSSNTSSCCGGSAEETNDKNSIDRCNYNSQPFNLSSSTTSSYSSSSKPSRPSNNNTATKQFTYHHLDANSDDDEDDIELSNGPRRRPSAANPVTSNSFYLSANNQKPHKSSSHLEQQSAKSSSTPSMLLGLVKRNSPAASVVLAEDEDDDEEEEEASLVQRNKHTSSRSSKKGGNSTGEAAKTKSQSDYGVQSKSKTTSEVEKEEVETEDEESFYRDVDNSSDDDDDNDANRRSHLSHPQQQKKKHKSSSISSSSSSKDASRSNKKSSASQVADSHSIHESQQHNIPHSHSSLESGKKSKKKSDKKSSKHSTSSSYTSL